MTQAESSSKAQSGAKAVTAGAPVDYELPWSALINSSHPGSRNYLG